MQNPPPPPPPSGPPPMSPPPPPPPSGGYMPPPPQPMGGYMPSSAPAGNYGGFWIRVIAYIIDFIILAVIDNIVDAIFHVNPTNPTGGGAGPAGLINLVIDIAYFAGQWSYFGATLGQRIFKLRVVDANTGQPIGIGKALLRWVGLFVSFLVCFVGVIWVAFDGRKQGWMDKIAGTLVLQG
jgi:uncharacterized RDD family membrane protein YckC